MTAEQALAELQAREPIFHRPELGTDYASMVTDDFWEVGASGKIYSRDFVLQLLAERRIAGESEPPMEASDFQCRKLSDEYFLLTYHLIQDRVRHTRRSTLWRWTESGWKIAYHQGTVILP